MDFSKPIEKYLSDMKKSIRQNLTVKGINASKRTYDSVSYAGEYDVGFLWAIRNLHTTETGTASKKRGGVVSFGGIFRWIYEKGIAPTDEKAAKAMAWAITVSIMQKGTITYQKGGRSDIFSNVLNDTKKSSTFAKDMAEITQIGLGDIFNKNGWQ
jgi:hypothetical protein